MKYKIILTFVLIFLAMTEVFPQVKYKTVKDPLSGREMLVGTIDTSILHREPFSEWFTPGYSSYQPETTTVLQLINAMAPEYSYVIVMGTWCSDSKREVPRMMKVLDEAGVPASHIEIYAVDREKKARHTPVNDLHIDRVPTLIVYNMEQNELGRIIESPTKSIEEDLLDIISGN